MKTGFIPGSLAGELVYGYLEHKAMAELGMVSSFENLNTLEMDVLTTIHFAYTEAMNEKQRDASKKSARKGRR